MCIHKYKVLARFGLMHLIATNLCVWLRGLVKESFTEPPAWIQSSLQQLSSGFVPVDRKDSFTDALFTLKKNISIDCFSGDLMGDVIRNSNPYLAPCTAQYSILALGLLWLTWRNIGKLFPLTDTPSGHSSPQPDRGGRRGPPTPSAALRRGGGEQHDTGPLVPPYTDYTTPHHRASTLLLLRRLQQPVECAGSNRGLFLGLTAVLATVVSLLLLHVLMQRPDYRPIGLGLVYSTELALLMCAAGASLAACFRMQDMLFQPAPAQSRLDTVFLLLGLAGVLCHSLTGILAGRYLARAPGAPFVVMSGLMSLVQAPIQAVFVATALRRTSYKAQHRLQRPGRQLVTFLLMANLALWLVGIFEHVRLGVVHLHVVFLGGPTVALLTNITLPLVVFYRFHAFVSLAVIWRRAYKIDYG